MLRMASKFFSSSIQKEKSIQSNILNCTNMYKFLEFYGKYKDHFIARNYSIATRRLISIVSNTPLIDRKSKHSEQLNNFYLNLCKINIQYFSPQESLNIIYGLRIKRFSLQLQPQTIKQLIKFRQSTLRNMTNVVHWLDFNKSVDLLLQIQKNNKQWNDLRAKIYENLVDKFEDDEKSIQSAFHYPKLYYLILEIDSPLRKQLLFKLTQRLIYLTNFLPQFVISKILLKLGSHYKKLDMNSDVWRIQRVLMKSSISFLITQFSSLQPTNMESIESNKSKFQSLLLHIEEDTMEVGELMKEIVFTTNEFMKFDRIKRK